MRYKSLFLIIALSAILLKNNVKANEVDLEDDYDDELVESVEQKEVTKSSSIPTTKVVTIAPNMTLKQGVERSGKFIDYNYLSNYDLNDQNYDWNGKFFGNGTVETPRY